MKPLKILILIVSTLMFLYQLYTAVILLLDPPTIDSSSEIDIADIDLPLITVCTTDQYERNIQAFTDLGFGIRIRSIRGELKKNKKIKTWGNFNKSYEEVLDVLYDKDVDKTLRIQYGDASAIKNYTRVFIPFYGHCSEIHGYDPRRVIMIKVTKEAKSYVAKFRVFITDSNFRSYFSPDYSSHRGEMAFAKQFSYNIFDIDVSIRSKCEVKPTWKQKDNFKTCVDDELQKQVTGAIGCTPPWMSDYKQCNKTYPAKFTDALPGFKTKFTDPPYWMKSTKIESDCRKFCSATTSTLTARSTKGTFSIYYNL